MLVPPALLKREATRYGKGSSRVSSYAGRFTLGWPIVSQSLTSFFCVTAFTTVCNTGLSSAALHSWGSSTTPSRWTS